MVESFNERKNFCLFDPRKMFGAFIVSIVDHGSRKRKIQTDLMYMTL